MSLIAERNAYYQKAVMEYKDQTDITLKYHVYLGRCILKLKKHEGFLEVAHVWILVATVGKKRSRAGQG